MYLFAGNEVRYVNVCQDDSASAGSDYWGYLVLDAAAAGAPPPQQDLACKCYLSFVSPLQYMPVELWIDVDGDQNTSYTIDGTVYNKTSYHVFNITSAIKVIYRHDKQDHHPRVCMAISTCK